jgi:hypothetical protein
MKKRPAWLRLGITALAGMTAIVVLATPAQAAEPVFQLPFPCGETWSGNNPGSSAHRTDWELDFNWGSGDDDLGKPVLASAAGTVEIASYQEGNGFGRLVKIKHGSSGYYTYYAHLLNLAVSVGDDVAQGELIGHVGNSSATNPGISPHLHYEVRGSGSYPGNIVPAKFNGARFPYPTGSVTSKNCGTAALKASKSINGDRYDDAIGVDADGVAWVYDGKAGGGFSTGRRLGPGWGGFDRIAIGDSNGDGWADLFATSGGTMQYWRNRGNGTFTPAVTVGAGWSAVEYFSFADVNGDNKTDILARDGGNMYLYLGRGNGSFAVRSLVGPGWGSLVRHTSADADADGDGDIWATNSAGDLFFWKRNGGSYDTAVEVGSGWNGFRQLTSMDINGDNRADIVAIRTSDNTLWQWLGAGTGRFGQGAQIGSGWTGFTLATY